MSDVISGFKRPPHSKALIDFLENILVVPQIFFGREILIAKEEVTCIACESEASTAVQPLFGSILGILGHFWAPLGQNWG